MDTTTIDVAKEIADLKQEITFLHDAMSQDYGFIWSSFNRLEKAHRDMSGELAKLSGQIRFDDIVKGATKNETVKKIGGKKLVFAIGVTTGFVAAGIILADEKRSKKAEASVERS